MTASAFRPDACHDAYTHAAGRDVEDSGVPSIDSSDQRERTKLNRATGL
jgi:hypothetical protein